jgi:hypothetical protein
VSKKKKVPKKKAKATRTRHSVATTGRSVGDAKDVKGRYQLVDNEREGLEDSAHADEDKFDRAVLTLSAAALGVCLGLIQPLAKDANAPALFGCAVVLLVVALLCAVWSLFVGAKASWATLRIRAAGHRHAGSWARMVGTLNFAALLCLTAGILCLTVFIALNIQAGEKT